MKIGSSLEGQARDWYLILPPGCIKDSDEFKELFMKRWSCNAQGTFNIENFYQIIKGREDVQEFIQKFDRVVKDILDHLKPSKANILDKFIKVMGGHLTYVLRHKKPSTLAEAKEKAMEVEENLRISIVDINDHLRAKFETKKKSKDQHEETLLAILKRMERFTEEANTRDMVIMNKIVALEKAQKSSYIPKGRPFPKN